MAIKDKTKQKKTDQKTTGQKKIRKSHHSRRTIAIFWICLILVLAPIVFLGWILFSAYLDTGTPVLGNRYEGDLDPAITKDDMSTIDEAVLAIEGVEDEFSTLATATLRVYVKVADTATADEATAMANSVYTVVSQTLDPTVYFTQADGMKMYDLEIHVYNLNEDADRTSDSFVYVIETKTSSMSEPSVQTVSEALDAELAQQLRDDVTARLEAEAAAEATAESTATTDATETAASE